MGHVRFHPDEVCIEQVSEGSEAALRDFLDVCLNEANERIRREIAERLEDEEALRPCGHRTPGGTRDAAGHATPR